MKAITISDEAAESLNKLPGVDLEEKVFMLRERVNDLEHALVGIVRAFDAPHRFPMLAAMVEVRKLLERMNDEQNDK